MRILLLPLLSALLLLPVLPAGAEVDWNVVRTLSLDGKPLDMALSDDNTRLFVLVEGGKVLVYSPGGALRETLVLDKPADGIELSKSGDILYLRSEEGKRVDIVRLDFIREITVGGSPVKGPAAAPVAVAVFSDFQ